MKAHIRTHKATDLVITQDASSMEISCADLDMGEFTLKQIITVVFSMVVIFFVYNSIIPYFGRPGVDFLKMLKNMPDFPDNMPQDPVFFLALGLPILASAWSLVSYKLHQARKIAVTPERILLIFPNGRQREIASGEVAAVQIRENIVDKSTQYAVVISSPEKKLDYLASVVSSIKFPGTIGGVPQPLRDIAEFIGKISGKPVRDVDRAGKDADFRSRPSL